MPVVTDYEDCARVSRKSGFSPEIEAEAKGRILADNAAKATFAFRAAIFDEGRKTLRPRGVAQKAAARQCDLGSVTMDCPDFVDPMDFGLRQGIGSAKECLVVAMHQISPQPNLRCFAQVKEREPEENADSIMIRMPIAGSGQNQVCRIPFINKVTNTREGLVG